MPPCLVSFAFGEVRRSEGRDGTDGSHFRYQQDSPGSAVLRHEIERAMNGLAAVTAAHDGTWHLGEADWSLDQDVGNLVFTTPHHVQAVAPAQINRNVQHSGQHLALGVGPSISEPPLAKDAKRLRAYGQQHGYSKLTTPKLATTEHEAWELTALAFLVCGANGAYRGPSGPTLVYMTFGELHLSKSE